MYSTIDDIKADLTNSSVIKLTDDNATPSAINTTIVNDKIAESEALINSFVKRVATLPITDAEDLLILKKISVSLTVCELWKRRTQADYPESIAFRNTEAMAMLEKIGNGKIKLNTATLTNAIAKPFLKVSRRTSRWQNNYFN